MMNETNNQSPENTNPNRRTKLAVKIGAGILAAGAAIGIGNHVAVDQPKHEAVQMQVDNTPEAQTVVPGTELTLRPNERRAAPEVEVPEVSEPHTDVVAEVESTPAPKSVDNDTKDEDKKPKTPHVEPITDLPPAPAPEEFTETIDNGDGTTIMVNEPPVDTGK
jgi:hypothetical protein